MTSPSTIGALALAAGTGLALPACATTYTTSGVLCARSETRANASIALTSTATWTCAGGARTLLANGIPDHSVGSFPNSGNPNTISTQSVSATFTTTPVYIGTATKVKEFGYALNGVKFDPGTAQTCTADCANGGADGSGSWHIEALGQNYFYLGTDYNNAHVQPGGSYHYHGMPNGILAQTGFTSASDTTTNIGIAGASGNTGSGMTLVGWAVDGFPIYARYGYKAANSRASALRVLNASWRIKSTLSSGRPATSIAPAGTFTEDYEYVARLGDLDECNGRTGVTPQFPKGIYYYVITDTFPFAPRCVMGQYTAPPPPPPPPAQ